MGAMETMNGLGMRFVAIAWSMMWQSSVLIILMLGVDWLIKKRARAVVRYALWMLVLVKLVLPVGLTSPTSPMYWVDSESLAQWDQGGEPDMPGTEVKAIQDELVTERTSVDRETGAGGDGLKQTEVTTANRSAIEPIPAPGADNPEPATASTIEPVQWQAVAMSGWVVVVLLLIGMLVQRYWFVLDLIRQSQPANEYHKQILNRCRERMGIRQEIDLRISLNTVSPSVCGLACPTILIPVAMAGHLDEEQIESILLHELAHVKRGDLWLNLIQTLLQIGYFYHPLVWLANSVIRRIREQAVDEAVLVAMGDQAPEYPETLLRVSKLAWSRPMLSLRLIGVVESKSALADRIRHILNRPLPKTARIGLAGLAAILVFGLVLLPMANGRNQEPKFVLKGVVSDDITGKPIAGARVGDAGYNDSKYWTVSDAQGRYEYKTFYEEHTIYCEAPGYGRVEKTLLTLAVGRKQQEDMNFELTAGQGSSVDFENMDFWKEQIGHYMTGVRMIDGEFLADRQIFEEGQSEPKHYRTKIDFKWNRDTGWYDYASRDLRENGHYERSILNDREDWWITERHATRSLAGKSEMLRQYQFGVMSEKGEWWPGDIMHISPVAELIAGDYLRIMVHQMKWDLRPISHRLNADGMHELVLKEVEWQGKTHRTIMTVVWEDGLKLINLKWHTEGKESHIITEWSDHVKVGGHWFARKSVDYDYRGENNDLAEVETVLAEKVTFNRSLAADEFHYRPSIGIRVTDKVEERDYVAWPDLEKIKASGGKEWIGIDGKVYLDGKPAKGVRVTTSTLYDPDKDIWRPISGQTDDDGVFHLEGLLPGFEYRITAVTDTGNKTSQTCKTEPDGRDVSGVVINLSSGYALKGIVTRWDGSPARDAVVKLTDFDEVRTDERGKYIITGLKPDRVYTVQSAAKGCAPYRQDDYKLKVTDDSSAASLDIELAQEKVLTGRIIDKNGQGIAGHRIIGFFDCFVGESWQWCNTYTDEEGWFRLGNLGDREYEILIPGGRKCFAAGDSPVVIQMVNDKFALETRPGRLLFRDKGDLSAWEKQYIDWFQQEDHFTHPNMRVKRIDALMKQAESDDRNTRLEAIARLGNIEAVQAVAKLGRIVTDSTDRDEVMMAMRALGRIGDVVSSDSLLNQLGNADDLVKSGAGAALSEIFNSGVKDWTDPSQWQACMRRYFDRRQQLKAVNGPNRLLESFFKAVLAGDHDVAMTAFLPGSAGANRMSACLDYQRSRMSDATVQRIKLLAEAIDWPVLEGGNVTMFPDRMQVDTKYFKFKKACVIDGRNFEAGKSHKLFETVFREVDGQWWLLDLRFWDERFVND